MTTAEHSLANRCDALWTTGTTDRGPVNHICTLPIGHPGPCRCPCTREAHNR